MRRIKSASENHPIVINGSLVVQRIYLANKEEEEQVELIMLQRSPKFWKLKEHLDFSESQCAKLGGNGYLGGSCENVEQKIVKVFRKLEAHRHLRVELFVHVFDKWEDEVLVMRVDGKPVWRNRFRSSLSGVNLCGNEYSDTVNVKVDKIVEHTSPEVVLEWEALTEKSSCEASFAIDHLMIHIK